MDTSLTDYAWLVPLLGLGTILSVVVFALVSKKNTEDRMDDPTVPKSTLAKDGPQGGVAFLQPVGSRGANVEAKPHVAPVLE